MTKRSKKSNKSNQEDNHIFHTHGKINDASLQGGQSQDYNGQVETKEQAGPDTGEAQWTLASTQTWFLNSHIYPRKFAAIFQLLAAAAVNEKNILFEI